MSLDRSQEDTQNGLVSTFYIQNTLYGIDTIKVQEVIIAGDITPVHQSASYIVGVINLRGKIVTIIDLAKKLNIGKTEIASDSGIFIVEWNDEFVGLLTDSIGDVVQMASDKVDPPPANIKGAQGKYFQGVYKQDDKELIALLDVDRVLNEE